MKKFLLAVLICLLFCTLTASANEYGLRGGVLNIVEGVDAYDGYSASSNADNGNKEIGGCLTNQAILKNRYHALLISVWKDGKTWRTDASSTTAVYQPGTGWDKYPNVPTLRHTQDGFTLTYGDTEQYDFTWVERGYYLLTYVRYGREDGNYNSYFTSEDGFQFWQSGELDGESAIGDAIWETDGINLGEFNITQMPRSLAELRRLNTVRACFDEADVYHTPILNRSGEKKGQKLAVYSAPDKSSYRSSSGKASMSTGGAYQVWGVENGWTMISYEVSMRTWRTGYVQAELDDFALTWANIPLTAAVDTFLTDDPFCSQYAQAQIPAGTALTGLTRVDEFYAYVAWEQNGQPIRGFVPLKDLQPMYDRAFSATDDLLYAEVCWDVMDAIIGKWCDADGIDRTRLVLYSGGSYRRHMPGDGASYREEGNFRVYRGADGAYVLVLRAEDNTETRYTLTRDFWLNLTNGQQTAPNPDGTVTVQSLPDVTLYRDEFSSIGNG